MTKSLENSPWATFPLLMIPISAILFFAANKLLDKPINTFYGEMGQTRSKIAGISLLAASILMFLGIDQIAKGTFKDQEPPRIAFDAISGVPLATAGYKILKKLFNDLNSCITRNRHQELTDEAVIAENITQSSDAEQSTAEKSVVNFMLASAYLVTILGLVINMAFKRSNDFASDGDFASSSLCGTVGGPLLVKLCGAVRKIKINDIVEWIDNNPPTCVCPSRGSIRHAARLLIREI